MSKENNFSIKGTVEFIHNNKEDISDKDKKGGEQNECKGTNACGLTEDKIAQTVYDKQVESGSKNKKDDKIESLFLKRDNPKHNDTIKKVEDDLIKADKTLIPSGRIEIKDKMFFSSEKKSEMYFIENVKYENYLFLRGVAVNMLFEGVDFSKTIFDSCYLKKCRFIRCSFEGAKFVNCNLDGSYFKDCNFDYVIFEKTIIDIEILECAPKKQNLRYKFARSLKLNYFSIGDHIKARKALDIELKATKKHLLDSWISGETWYKMKYGGLIKRGKQFGKWFEVSLLDIIWGNGESIRRLIVFNLSFLVIITFFFTILKTPFGEYDCGLKFLRNFKNIIYRYFSLTSGNKGFLDLILVIMRLVSVGLLMSIFIKRYNRR